MRIAEIFRSLQGEGFLTGTPSVFVRASGCNLRCWFCDTPYTSWEPEGDDWSVEAIVEEVQELAAAALLPRPSGEGGSSAQADATGDGPEAIAWPESQALTPTLSQRERGNTIRHVVIT